MTRWKLSQWAEMSGGSLQGEDQAFDGVCTDSRQLSPGALFVAIRGPRFDGHQFAEQALRAGAVGVMIDQEADLSVAPAVRVEDTVVALGRCAAAWRRGLDGPLIAVTGSNGKTTVRRMVAAILESHWPGQVLATRGNLNNEIGLPLTLLERREEHGAAIVELGANHPGEIERLGQIAQPDVAIITNAGPAHLEGFGDLDGVARAKGELLDSLPAHGLAILNADDPRVDVWRALAAGHSRIEFGLERGDVRPLGQVEATADGSRMAVSTPVGDLQLHLPLPGRHNQMNAMAAVAAAVAADIPLEAIQQGLAMVDAEPGRLQLLSGPHGCCLVNDCYNANPASLSVAMDWLSQQSGRRWLLLGDMGELGEQAESSHRQAGEAARRAGVERLLTLGELAGLAGETFPGAEHFSDHDALIEQLAKELHGEVTLLVKGSRAMGLERVVEGLRHTPGRQAGQGS